MRILLVGSGGREAALAFKLQQSPLLQKLYVWPARPTTLIYAHPTSLSDEASAATVAEYCKQEEISLVIVGPEKPLEAGLSDSLLNAGIAVFGPRQQAALLETSKSFAKEMMRKAAIPTAVYQLARDADQCRSLAQGFLDHAGAVVLKASGLAAGKGVFVCQSQSDLETALERLYQSPLKEAASEVLVEECLQGREVSYFCGLGRMGKMSSLGFAVDYKRLKDGHKGPNTGGMGCYTPVPWLPQGAEDEVLQKVVRPLCAQLLSEGIDYTGWLYCGLMWTAQGPQVIEFNVRLGDPEAQVLSVADPKDWLEEIAWLLGLNESTANSTDQQWHSGFMRREQDLKGSQSGAAAVCVVLASEGYPYGGAAERGAELPQDLFGGGDGQEVRVFGSSLTGASQGMLLTGSGRVLSVVAQGRDHHQARQKVYKGVEEVQNLWPHCQFRKDIAADAE